MNIGIVTTWYESGAAYVSGAYMKALSDKHKVFIYARGGRRKPKGDLKWDQPYVTWDERISGKSYMYIEPEKLKKWVRQNQIEVIIFNEQHNWETVLDALKIDNITIGAYVDFYISETVPFFWLYDFLLCNTKRHYEVYKNHPQAIYIPWGTDLDLFQKEDRQNSDKDLVFFHSCGWSPPRKGADILVNAFQNVTGNTKLIIHAQRALDEFPLIEAVVEQDPRIKWIEADVGPPGLYHLGDVYVYPTRLEGIGLTIAEALASGLPVITTDEPPMNEFIVNQQNGMLVEVEEYKQRADNYYWPQSVCNAIALTQAMQFYVDNCTKIGEFSHRARQYAEERLDWSLNAAHLPALVETLSRKREQYDQELERAALSYMHSYYPESSPRYRIMNIFKKLGLTRVIQIAKQLLSPNSNGR